MKNYSTLFCMLLLFCIFIKVTAKSYDDQNFICADEIGPVLEFFVPNFTENSFKKDIIFKLFEKENRNKYIKKKGIIEKKSSPIDNTYFHYDVNYISNEIKNKSLKFEFFPPTTAMFQIEGSQFLNLVCWQRNLIN